VIVCLLVMVLLLAATAVLAGLETGLYSLERVRLEVSAAKGDRAALRLLAIIANPATTLCALLLATSIAHYALAHFADQIVDDVFHPAGELSKKILDTILLGPILFVLGDLVPKNVFMRVPGGLMRAFEPVLSVLRIVFLPLSLPLVKVAGKDDGALSASGRASLFDRGGIHFLLTVDDESAQLTEGQRKLAQRVLELRSVRVQDRMVPLRRVSAVPSDATAAAIVEEGARGGHSRLPVFAPDRTRFVGYVNVVDAATAGPAFQLREALHQLPQVPCDLPVTTALYRLQRAGRPIASVSTPDGRTILGIVAVSDIVAALFRS
jgi:putative hemolysin